MGTALMACYDTRIPGIAANIEIDSKRRNKVKKAIPVTGRGGL
jgi:hypothetical protein